MRRKTQLHRDAVENTIEWHVEREGMTFGQVADAARLAIVSAFVKSLSGKMVPLAADAFVEEISADIEAANRFTENLLLMPGIGKEGLFACYQTVHFCALVKHYTDETSPLAPTYQNDDAAMAKASEQDAELKRFLKDMLG